MSSAAAEEYLNLDEEEDACWDLLLLPRWNGRRGGFGAVAFLYGGAIDRQDEKTVLLSYKR